MATKKEDSQAITSKLANEGARRGGQARAAVLTATERREIARRAVLVRWKKQKGDDYEPPADRGPGALSLTRPGAAVTIPHSMYQGKLRIGPLDLECHVLSDGGRVFIQASAKAPRKGARGSVELKTFISLAPPIHHAGASDPNVQFLEPKGTSSSRGYEATYLVEIASAYLRAKDRGRLTQAQESLAKHAEVITRALAKVGISALIDNATGFEHVRLKRALQSELQAFIALDIQAWALTFPEEFWSELARLEGVRYSPRSRPLRWGRYVMLFVYDAIDHDVESRLKVGKPDPLFQNDHIHWLQAFSKDQLNRHLQRIVGVMKLCQNMSEFRTKLDRVFRRVPSEIGFSPTD